MAGSDDLVLKHCQISNFVAKCSNFSDYPKANFFKAPSNKYCFNINLPTEKKSDSNNKKIHFPSTITLKEKTKNKLCYSNSLINNNNKKIH